MGVQPTMLMEPDDYGSGGGDFDSSGGSFDGPPDPNWTPSGPVNYNATTVTNTTPIGFGNLRDNGPAQTNPDKFLSVDGTQIYVTNMNVHDVAVRMINSIGLKLGQMPSASDQTIIEHTVMEIAKLPDIRPGDGLYNNGQNNLQSLVQNAALAIRQNQLGRKLTLEESGRVIDEVKMTLGFIKKPDGAATTSYLSSLKTTLDNHGSFTENINAAGANISRGAKALVLGTGDFISDTTSTITNSVGGLFKLADVAGYVLLAWGVYQFMKKGK